jgi:hypothetical protein
MPKQSEHKKQKVAFSEEPRESLESRVQTFADVYDRVTRHPAVFAAIQRSWFEAFCSWAVMKMGVKRQQYMVQAATNFGVLCALRVMATNRNIEEVANEIPYELPLKLTTNKRRGFTELIPELYPLAAEYVKVCELAKAEKADKNWTAAQFRINLVASLERFAEKEELQPALSRDQLQALVKNFDFATEPSDIALAYVGKRHCTSGANVKKLLGLVRDPKRMQEALAKDLNRRFLPPDFEAIKQSLTTG